MQLAMQHLPAIYLIAVPPELLVRADEVIQ
jgi:hypothetical protein